MPPANSAPQAVSSEFICQLMFYLELRDPQSDRVWERDLHACMNVDVMWLWGCCLASMFENFVRDGAR